MQGNFNRNAPLCIEFPTNRRWCNMEQKDKDEVKFVEESLYVSSLENVWNFTPL